MYIKEKFMFICKCVEHIDKYCLGNKTKFWTIISELLKKQTGYKLISPQQTIMQWIKA